ncbi:MAG: AMP-binding protein, partial [Candidatus Dormibacteraeota bacterium]|nr:AMP-binding protein [Candidatus Dormibacteraeota bacterium]
MAQRFVHRHLESGDGGRVALVTPGRHWTYAELAELVDRCGNALLTCGVQQGDRMLLALSDSIEFVALWFAAQKIGAVTAEVYTFLQPKDYAYYLAYTAARVVAVDTTTIDAVRQALRDIETRPTLLSTTAGNATEGGEHDLFSLLESSPAQLDAAPLTLDDVAIWKFTTGSTGRPKACVHRLSSPIRSFENYATGVLGLRRDDSVLAVPKLFFGYARDLVALFPLGVAARGILFPERSTPERIFDLIERERPSILVNVPTMMQAMLDHPSAPSRDLSSLRLCTSAGEALPEALHRRWLDIFGVEVLDGIGSSEAYHIYISNRPGRARIGTMGECVPGYDAVVADPDGNPLPDGETGRLWIQGDTAAIMYWGDEARSRETFGENLVR